MAIEKVNEYLENRKKKLEAEGKTTNAKKIQTTNGPAKGGSFGDADKVNEYLKRRQERIEKSDYEKWLLERDRAVGKKVAEREAEKEAAKKAQKAQIGQQMRTDMAIDSIESQAMEAIKARLQQGKGAFEQTDREQGLFSGYEDPVQLALNVQGLKGIGPQKTWREEALKLGQQAIEQKRQEYAQMGTVDEYLEKLRTTNMVFRDDEEKQKYLDEYYSNIPYASDYEQKQDNPYTRLTDEERVYEQLDGTYSQRDERMDAMTDDELKIMTYLRNTQGMGAAQRYYAQLESELGERVRNGYAERAQKFGQERPVLGSALSTWMNMGNAIRGGAYVAGNALDKLTGQGTEIDPYDRAFEMGAVRDAIRGGVSEDMPGWGKFLYDTGMSMADTAAMGLALGPTGGALLMGSGAAVDTVRDVKERGGSDQQALTMGLVAGGAELLTEKLGFDRLGEMIGGSRGNVFREILGAMTSEGFEEGVTEIANILTDVLVMGDASNYAAAVRQYMLKGMGEKEAHIKALWEMAAQIGLAALGGGLMGGAMGGGAATVGAAANRIDQNQQARINALHYGARGSFADYGLINNPQQPAANDISSVGRADTFPSNGEAQTGKSVRTVSPAIEQMAQEYGEDAKTFKAYYEGGDAAQYKRGFDAMFNAGKSGLSLETLGGVSDQLTKGMSEVTKQSIYTAGRNRAANTITPGVQRLTTKKLGNNQKAQLMILDAIGKEYGLEIDVVDSIKDSNAVYRRGGRRIVVALDAAEGAYVQAAAHEAVHYIRSMDANGYEVLKDVVLKHLTGEDAMFDLDAAISERMAQYAKHNRSLTEDDAIEEIVAEAVPTFFADKEAVRAFVKENRTLAKKIRDFFVEFANKVREIAERYMVSQDRAEIAEILDETAALKEIAQTFDLALRSAQGKQGAAKGDGEVMEATRQSIKKDDVDRLRSIGQKSIANFTSEEIRATQGWAEKFYEELGAKSPYFRAWFGDWRENDTSAVTISKLQVDDEIPKGRYTNVDTGWDVAVSSVGINDTVAHSNKGNVSVHALYGVDDLIVNAILLDTEASVPRGKKKENTAFMHKMYAPFTLDEKAYIAKLTVEEVWDNRDDTLKRLYNLRAIETASADAYSGFAGNADHSTTSTKAAGYSVADLFADVKKVDKDFNYAGKSSAIVNADGTPKVMYHGSQASFTAFDKRKARSSGLYGRGFYFTDSDAHAGQYGSLYQVYLKAENPLAPGGSTATKAQVKKFLEAVAENEDDYSIENYGTYDVNEIMKKVYKKDAFAVIQDVNATAIGDMVEAVKLFNEVNGTKFDGIVVPTETVVFEPTQIKSATDNVGTFDPEDTDIRYSLKSTSYPTASEAREAAEANRAQTQTEAFKEWFEGSVVVNEDGSPKIMYHGTSKSGFNWFRTQEGKYGLMGMGAYFTENPEVAQGYTRKGRGKTPGVYPVYLAIKNPIDMDAKAGALAAKWQEFFGEELDGRQLDGDMTNEEILRIVEDALMDAELPDYEAYDYFSQFYEDNDIDGITHMGGGRWGNGPRHRVYIALSGYQVKSATGNEGEFSGDEIDIRYSLKSDQQKAVREAQAEDWKQISAGEIMVQDLKVDEETVRRQAAGALNKGLRDKLNQQISMAANRILRDTESKYGRNELKEQLHEIVKQYAANGFDTHTALSAEALANQIIDQSTRKVQSEAAEAYQEVRRKLREAKITLTDTQRQEVENEYGSVAAYRRQVFGTVNVRNEGVTLESLWSELSGKHPEIFPPDTGEAQMPGVIAQFDQLMRPRYENIYGMDAEAAAHDLAMRIQGDVLGMIGAKNAAHDLYGTADKFRKQIRAEYDREIRAQQKARVDEFQQIAGRLKAAKDQGDDEAQKKLMTEYRKALKKVDVKTAIAEVRATEKVRYQQQTENRERAQLRDKITKRANELMDMLNGREKGKRVPTVLQGLVLDVLGALDVNGQRAAEQGTETQRAAQFREKLTGIKNFYAQVWDSQSKGESPEGLDGLMMTLSERNVAEMTEALEVLGSGEAFYLRDMDSKQLKSLDALLKNVKHTVDSIGKLWRIQRYESIIQLGDASIAEMDSRGPQKITNKAAGAARDFFALDNMEPVSYGERLGEAGAAVIQSLMDGEKIKFGKVREASKATEKMLKEVGIRGYDIGRWRKKVQEVTFGGAKVRMTDAMLMSLYLTAKRPQGRQHLLGGGFVLRDPKRTGAQEETIRPTEADLAHIAGLLSDKQRQLADRMGEYLSTAVAKWGNDVTQRMYLYDAFTEKHYWPLSSDSSYHKTEEPEADRMFNAIVNASFTKQTNAKANDELVIMDAFDIFGKHIGEMASYAGYAEAMTDTLAWLNYKVRNSETNLNEASVKRSMKKLLGNGGVDYMTKLLQDINGARRETEKTLVDKIGKNAKAAAVVGKISVAIQQPTSIVRAAAEINPWHLIKALRPTKGLPKGKSIGEWLRSNGTVEEMQKWSNLAWWKSNGNYDIGIGKGTDAILWGDTSRLQTAGDIAVKVGELGFDPGKMDDLTWAHMWLAVKSEIKRKRRDLEVGSDEFFRAVAERFEYVMDRTQVVDTVMHRSALMRSKNDVTKQLTSFMSEPTKSYNMLMRAVMEVGRKPNDATAHKRLMRTTAAFAASVVANAAAKGLYEAFRYRDDDEDKLLEYMVNGEFTEDWEKRILNNMVSGLNPLENIPIVSTVYEAIPGDRIAKYLGFGQASDYLPSGDVAGHMGLEGISDLIKAGVDALQYMLDDNSGKRTKYGVWGALVKAVSEAFGLPFAGIMTNVETLGRIFNPKWAQSKSELHSMEAAYQALYKAMRDGDKQKVLSIRTELARGLYGAEPKSPKQIDTGIAHELARQDERVMKAYEMKLAGNQTDKLVATRKAIMADGFTEAQVNAAINYCETLMKGETTSGEKDMNEQLEASLFKKADLFSAMRSGDSDDVMAVMDYLLENSEAADPEKSLKSAITEEFKQEYINLVSSGRTSEAQKLAKTLQGLGLYATDGKTNYYSDKKLAEWVEDWEKAQEED